MQINSIASSTIAPAVWLNSTRTLTQGFLSTSANNSRTSVGAGNILAIASGGGPAMWCTFAPATPGTAGQLYGVYDGVNFDGQETISATSCVKTGVVAGSVGLAYKNGSAGALTCAICAIQSVMGV